jgi:hypothetical protein
MAEQAEKRSALGSRLRISGALALLVAVMLFAPIGQGVGLSAGQGVSTAGLGAGAAADAANGLAAQEVERLVARS